MTCNPEILRHVSPRNKDISLHNYMSQVQFPRKPFLSWRSIHRWFKEGSWDHHLCKGRGLQCTLKEASANPIGSSKDGLTLQICPEMAQGGWTFIFLSCFGPCVRPSLKTVCDLRQKCSLQQRQLQGRRESFSPEGIWALHYNVQSSPSLIRLP